MHLNYYFLKQVSSRLNTVLPSTVLQACFSQHKNEVTLQFAKQGTSTPINLVCQTGNWTCLSFPEVIHRRKRNSVDLFGEIIGKSVTAVNNFDNERAFLISFSDEYGLVFKLFGHMSNVVLVQGDRISTMLRKKLKEDATKNIGDFHRQLEVSQDNFLENPDVKRHFPTLGARVVDHLMAGGYSELPPKRRWALVQKTIGELESPSRYWVCTAEEGVHLSLLQTADCNESWDDPMAATTVYFGRYLRFVELKQAREKLERTCKKEIAAISSYISKSQRRLAQLTEGSGLKRKADLLMAHLAEIPKGASQVNLPDFQGEELIQITLKPALSVQENAEKYYQKAKRQSLEVDNINENIELKEREKKKLESTLSELSQVSSLKELRALSSVPAAAKEGKVKDRPFLERTYEGYTILIGKSAKQNDLLLQKFSTKNDLWLHVKDAQGSHVIVRSLGANAFPKNVIERAAELAAYYSKRKSETWCPVSYTSRKYVRKRKNDPPGMVRVDREEVILVKPQG